MASQVELKYSIYDTDGKTKQESALKLKVATDSSSYVVHRAMVKQFADRRQGTASTKTRSEVRGGGRKPWKQKGSGRARAGSNRSPLWKGGGVTFGPKPRSYAKKMNRKEWRLALRTLLHNKYNDTIIVKDISSLFESPSTKSMSNLLQEWKISIAEKSLIVLEHQDQNIYLSARNLPSVKTICASNLNILDLLNSKNIIITQAALNKIQEVFND
uniref:Large ribosomal subunit protein uL4c n=1 Tax=Bangiopsis subsimplex TaxID=139980 RepID=A0A1C9CD21_9RHOD|nr:ribosomal protein L4 [Bangiopsis subsimplex]AOM66275.1 ribosomal protein L4 [Bangiopsis subsimplex]ARO90363.1 50S ribosomal protein L4 [Bangiopsis subsimplex]